MQSTHGLYNFHTIGAGSSPGQSQRLTTHS